MTARKVSKLCFVATQDFLHTKSLERALPASKYVVRSKVFFKLFVIFINF